jgi:hypothetical protein
MVGVIVTNWNQVKLELITMSQIVKTAREEANPVAFSRRTTDVLVIE